MRLKLTKTAPKQNQKQQQQTSPSSSSEDYDDSSSSWSSCHHWKTKLLVVAIVLMAGLVLIEIVRMAADGIIMTPPASADTTTTTTTSSSSSAAILDDNRHQKFLGCVDDNQAFQISYSERTHIPQVLEDAYLLLDDYLDEHSPLSNDLKWRDSRPQGVAAIKLDGVKVNFLWNAIQNYLGRGYPCNTVCEVGINAGHSSVLWLEACPQAKAVLFDMPYKTWSQPAFEYLRTMYNKGRVEIIEGNSLETIPQYTRQNPDWRCDIIAIDGSKDPAIRYQDFQNFRKVISHPDSLLLLDDASYEVMLNEYIFLDKNNITEAMKEKHDLNALYSSLLLTNYVELDGACSFAGALNPRQNSSLAGRFHPS